MDRELDLLLSIQQSLIAERFDKKRGSVYKKHCALPKTPVFQLSSDMMIFNFIFSDYTELYRMKAFF